MDFPFTCTMLVQEHVLPQELAVLQSYMYILVYMYMYTCVHVHVHGSQTHEIHQVSNMCIYIVHVHT